MVREDLRAGRFDVKAIKQVLSFVTQKLAQLDKEIAYKHFVKHGHVAEAVKANKVTETLAKKPSGHSLTAEKSLLLW